MFFMPNANYKKKNLKKKRITHVPLKAKFVSPTEVEAGGVVYTAPHILIAVGGEPSAPDCEVLILIFILKRTVLYIACYTGM